MSTTTPLGHFEGIPDDFIRALNQRFRELEAIRQPKPPAAPDVGDLVAGASELENVGAIPKVADDGELEESALIDDGTRITSSEPLRVDIGAAPAETPIGVRAAGGGFLGLRVNGPDSLAIHFDYERTGGANIARDTSIAALVKGGDFLLLYYNSGETPGSPITALNLSAAINLANGKWGFGGNAAPAYEVDVNGVVNASTAYRVGGNLGVTGTFLLAKITPGGGNGSISFVGGIPVGVVAPT